MCLKKILSKTPDHEYYNKEVNQLKVKVKKCTVRGNLGTSRSGSETIVQGVTDSEKEGTGDIFTFGLTK